MARCSMNWVLATEDGLAKRFSLFKVFGNSIEKAAGGPGCVMPRAKLILLVSLVSLILLVSLVSLILLVFGLLGF